MVPTVIPPAMVFPPIRASKPFCDMEPVEIKLLKYTFRFRHLSWREETAIKFDKGADRSKVILAHALTEVSGLKVNSPAEATKVLNAIPRSVTDRVMILYRGVLPMPRRFSTTGLYKAPAAGIVAKRFEQVEQQREEVMDRVEVEMRQKFGDKEVAEAIELERQMLRNSKARGATPATPDEKLFGTTPPITQPANPGVKPKLKPSAQPAPSADKSKIIDGGRR
jgi:hypothetical protein